MEADFVVGWQIFIYDVDMQVVVGKKMKLHNLNSIQLNISETSLLNSRQHRTTVWDIFWQFETLHVNVANCSNLSLFTLFVASWPLYSDS